MTAPSQLRIATTFALRTSASHALSLYLAWLAFTKGTAALAGVVLALRAATGLVVPLAVGRLHDRGGLRPLLKASAVIEAVAAVALTAVRSSSLNSSVLAVSLALVLGSTSALFETVVYPLVLAGRPGKMKPHVMVGLSFDVAKIAGSSVVLALLAVWHSPIPMMAVSALSLAGWQLAGPAREGPSTTAREETQQSVRVTRAVVWTLQRLTAVGAIALVALLPGQLVAYQTALAEDSFRAFAILGTAFAVGAVIGNLILQRVAVSVTATSIAYAGAAISFIVSLWMPVLSMVLLGVGVAAYYQLTRALVVGTAPAALQGHVAGWMTAASKVCGVIGALVASQLTHHTQTLLIAGCAVMIAAALALCLAKRFGAPSR